MDEMKVLNKLSIWQRGYAREDKVYKALQLAMDDISLVMNILAIYNVENNQEEYLLRLDDVIKGFLAIRRSNYENNKY